MQSVPRTAESGPSHQSRQKRAAAQQPCAVPTYPSQYQSSGAGVALGVEYTDSAVSPVVRLQPDTSSRVPGRTAPENHLQVQSDCKLRSSMRMDIERCRALRFAPAEQGFCCCAQHTRRLLARSKCCAVPCYAVLRCARCAPEHHAAVAHQAVAARALGWVGGHKHLHRVRAASRWMVAATLRSLLACLNVPACTLTAAAQISLWQLAFCIENSILHSAHLQTSQRHSRKCCRTGRAALQGPLAPA